MHEGVNGRVKECIKDPEKTPHDPPSAVIVADPGTQQGFRSRGDRPHVWINNAREWKKVDQFRFLEDRDFSCRWNDTEFRKINHGSRGTGTRETVTETERRRHRQTDRQRDRETERQTDRQMQRESTDLHRPGWEEETVRFVMRKSWGMVRGQGETRVGILSCASHNPEKRMIE